MVNRRSKNGPASLLRGGKGGRGLLGALGFRSMPKRSVSCADQPDHCKDKIHRVKVQKYEQPLLVARRQNPSTGQGRIILPIPPSLAVTHFHSFTEVKAPYKALADEESEITGWLPPPISFKVVAPPHEDLEVCDRSLPPPLLSKVIPSPSANVEECKSTSTESSSAASTSITTTKDNNSNSAAEYRHQRHEAKLLQELFHDLTCRCFTTNEF